MALPDIISRTTAKNVRGKPGHSPYIIEFSDRYSVYEWGEMPDDIQGKAIGLAYLSWFFFDHLGRAEVWQQPGVFPASVDKEQLAKLAEHGLSHHMLGLAGGDLRPLTLDREILSPSKLLLVRPLAYPESDAANATAVGLNRVLPVSVRFEMGAGRDMLPGVTLLESCDNACAALSIEEAAVKCGLPASEIQALTRLCELIALRLTATCVAAGLQLTAGRLSFAVTEGAFGREFMLADTLGPDTLSFEAQGVKLSPDMLCHSYQGSTWQQGVERAKALATERGDRDWKRICQEELKAQPPLLSPLVKEKAAMIYKSIAKVLCRQYHGREIFANAWEIPHLVERLAPREHQRAAG